MQRGVMGFSKREPLQLNGASRSEAGVLAALFPALRFYTGTQQASTQQQKQKEFVPLSRLLHLSGMPVAVWLSRRRVSTASSLPDVGTAIRTETPCEEKNARLPATTKKQAKMQAWK